MDSSELDKIKSSLSYCRHNSRIVEHSCKVHVLVPTYLTIQSFIYCNLLPIVKKT